MTAIALSYGIFKSAKKLFHDTEPTHIMFVDIGQSVCSIGIVSFTSENMVVKSVVNEHHLAGRCLFLMSVVCLCGCTGTRCCFSMCAVSNRFVLAARSQGIASVRAFSCAPTTNVPQTLAVLI